MVGYTKLFGSLLASTIWREDDKVRIVWITLLAMADKRGIAEGSIPGIADLARVSIEDCERALARLQQPDRFSRSTENEGRRIAPTDGGFQILNHAKYRDRLSAEDRREYKAAWMADKRKRPKPDTPSDPHVDTCGHDVDTCGQPSTAVDSRGLASTVWTHTEAEAEADTEANTHTQERVCVIADEPKPKEPKPEPPMDSALLDANVTERAGRFIERYEVAYTTHRKGARYLVKPHRDYEAAVGLCRTWPDDRLDKLAAIFLTTDHEWAERGSRTIPQFSALASWCDSKLTEWEQKQQAVARGA